MFNTRSINQDIAGKYKGLEFEEEGHKYKYKGTNLQPVSNVVGQFYEPFNEDFYAKLVARRDGLTKQQVKDSWELKRSTAANFGTNVHSFAERYVEKTYFSEEEDYSISIVPGNSHELAVVNYWNNLSNRYLPVSLELRMFSEELFIAGTCDVLLFDSVTEGFVLLDYKTNENLFKNYKGQLMFSPFEYMLDNNYNHYQIQLSLYQMLLESKGYKVTDRIIVWLKGDGSYEEFHTHDLTSILKTVL